MSYSDGLKYPSEVRTKWNKFELTNLPFKIVDFEKGLISNMLWRKKTNCKKSSKISVEKRAVDNDQNGKRTGVLNTEPDYGGV